MKTTKNKSVIFTARIWPELKRDGSVTIRITGKTFITTVENLPQRKSRFHRPLYRALERILKKNGKWPTA